MSFWNVFWLLAIFLPLAILWCLTLVDVLFRRPGMPGIQRVLWVVAIFVFPWIGALVYFAIYGGSVSTSSRGQPAPRQMA